MKTSIRRRWNSCWFSTRKLVDAVVVPVPHIIKGSAPAALVTLRRDAEVDESALKEFTLANGPAYAHPRRIFSVDELPLKRRRQDRSDAGPL